MDGLQVSTDSDKIVGSRVVPSVPLFASSPAEEKAKHEHTTANPSGLSPLNFGLLVAAVTCILTAAVVGGVVGGVVGHKHPTVSVDFYLSLV